MLGTVGEISPKELRQRRNRGVKQGTIIGKAGLEYAYDRYLRGRDGAKVLQASTPTGASSPTSRSPSASRSPAASCASRSTSACRRPARTRCAAIGGGLPGAFVAMNPQQRAGLRDGLVPELRPVDRSPSRSRRRAYEQLTSEENGAPLINRAIAAHVSDGLDVQAGHRAGRRSTTGLITPGHDDLRRRLHQDRQRARRATRRRRRTARVEPAPRRAGLLRRLLLPPRPRPVLGGGEPLQKWAQAPGASTAAPAWTCPRRAAARSPDRKWREELNDERAQVPQDQQGQALLRGRASARTTSATTSTSPSARARSRRRPLQTAIAYSTLVTGGRVPRPHLGIEVQDSRTGSSRRSTRAPRARSRSRRRGARRSWTASRWPPRQEPGTSAGVFAGWPNDR